MLQRFGDESLYLPGDPGAGKSTFCRWLALVTAEGRVPEHPVPSPEGYAERLPVLRTVIIVPSGGSPNGWSRAG